MTKEIEIHDRRVAAVTDAVAKLSTLPQMTPEAVFEGSIKGAAIVMLSETGCAAADVAQMIRDFGDAIENAGKPKLGLVK